MNQALKRRIQAEIRRIGSSAPALMSSDAADKLYEVFVLTRIVRALKDLDAYLEPRSGTDEQDTQLVFRMSPGRLMYSQRYSFIFVRYRGHEYEIHNGLRVKGISGVLNELDVSMLARRACRTCVRLGRDPSARHVTALAECKCYNATDLTLGLGRAFVGLLHEFRSSRTRVRALVSTKTKADLTPMIEKHGGSVHFDVCHTGNGLAAFDRWLQSMIRKL